MRTIVLLVRPAVLTCLFAFFSFNSQSQSISFQNGKYELGLGLGPMFFLGDLGGSEGKGKTFIKDLDLPLTKLNKGLFLNYYPVEWLGFRLAANLGMVEGDDKQAPNKGGAERFRLQRNLNFRSKISEAYLATEIYPTVFLEKYDGLAGKLRPYGVAGIGIYHFDPEAKDNNGEWIKTAPLRLEGQGMAEYPDIQPYKLTQMNLLMGFGLKYYFSENKYIGLEVLHRKLFTDYVDDVSSKKYIDPINYDRYLTPENAVIARRLAYRGPTLAQGRPYHRVQQRGDPTENDAFFSTLVRMGWRLGQNSAMRQLKCPVFY